MDRVLDNNILIIEGKKTTPPLLIDQIRQFDFRDVFSISPDHAFEKISGKKIDIIFYRLEELAGQNENVIHEIQRYFPEIPIVLVSKNSDPSLMRRAIRLGVYDYLTEPFELPEIPAVIARNIERKLVNKVNIEKKQTEILMKAIEALIAAMEAKDKDTSGHSKRVVEYTLLLADKLDLNGHEKFILQLSAALHDIGKIGMPDDILNKVSSLQDKEQNIVREHPLIGSKIVAKIDELEEVSNIIKHHHERYDGSGYPGRLKGENIPLFSRILAIVDTYEALVSDRIYRKKINHENAVMELRRSAGTQFDPALVNLFVEVINKTNGNNNKNKKY